MDIKINHGKCVLYDCLECLDICPMDLFTIRDNCLVVSDLDKCCRCLMCQNICEYNAIRLDY
jgi:NAD-dependent dihydropyrimidine dehydrogenase PreA subunit